MPGVGHAERAVLGNRRLARFNVCIIGSGAGGASVARVLTAAGKNVLVLEAGGNAFPGLDRRHLPFPLHGNVGTRFGAALKSALRDGPIMRQHGQPPPPVGGRAAADQSGRPRSPGARRVRAAGAARHVQESQLRAAGAALLHPVHAPAPREHGRAGLPRAVRAAPRRPAELGAPHGHAPDGDQCAHLGR